ncbi:MAG: efflux RND transporter permease subunit [Candidatus Eisenbacteria bacterium]
MSIPGFAMRNYRFILVLSVAGILLGIVGFLQMPRQEDPNMSAYWNTVTAIYPGATAEEVEDRVVEPLEEAADELEEIRELRSVSLEGVGVLQVEFREDVDVEEANRLLVERITSKRSELPDGVLDVKVEQRKPSNVVMLEVAVHGMTSDSLLQEWAEELADRLRLLDDSKAVDTYGRREQEVAVLIDPARIGEMGLSLSGIARRVSAAGGEIPGGVVHAGDRRLSIRPSERLASLEDVRNIVISTVDGRPVRLRDVATVDWTTTEARHRVRYDGESAVLVTVSLKEGRNVFHLAEQARRTLASFQGDLPSDVSATVVLDQSRDVKDRLHNFWRNLLQGGAIISIFVAIIVGWRSALVVISAMLLSVTVSFGLMQAWGIVLQQMSIAGLVVVLGLLVDNAIVVVEAIARERRSGLDAIRAAVTGTERVAAAVASSTATTVAAFVPMMRTAGSVGEFTRDIPRVVSLVLVVSLAVAVCMTPLVAARLFRTERSVRSFGMSDWIERNITQRGYRRLIGQAVERPVRVIALVLLGAVALIALFPVLGMSFFPAAEKPVFLVELSTPQGTSFESTEAQAVKVSSYLRSELGVLAVTSNIGDGNPVMYYNHLPAPSASHRAELVVTIDRERVREIPELARRIRGRFADDPDVVVEPKILVQGPPIGLPVSIEIMGEDLERLRAHADRPRRYRSEIPGAVASA